MSGTADNIKGKAKEAVGDLADDRELQREGKIDQAAGAAKEKLEGAQEWLADKVDDIKGAVRKD